MIYKKKKKGNSLKIVIVALLVILFLLGGFLAFFILGGADLFSSFGKGATPYMASGEVQALTLAPTGDDATEEGLRAYYAEAVAFAKENGINTLVYQGKKGLTVYWRDSIFPPAEEILAQDSFFNKIDPLALLCEAAEGSELQIWVSADFYAGGAYTSEMNQKVAKLAASRGSSVFGPTDEEYNKLLVKSLTALPHKYPIAGVVFENLNTSAENPVQDTAAWNTSFAGVVSQVSSAWRGKGYQAVLGLGFSGSGGALLTPETAASLYAEGSIAYLLPSFSAGSGLQSALAAWQVEGAQTIAVAPETNAELVLFSSAASPTYAGALLGGYPEAARQTAELGLLKSTLATDAGVLPTGYDIPQTLSINYPVQNAKIYTTGLFIMGTSNPDVPLYMNGAEVARRTAGGAFGVAVELATGTNTFTFTQNEATYTLTVTKPEATGGGTTTPMPSDATQEAQPGQVVRINTVIASALSNYADDGAMNETFHKGATAVVKQSVQTTRYDSSYGRTVKTWAYQLTSGDYVLARNCEWVSGADTGSFTGLASESAEYGEWLNFEGTGTPAAYVSYGNDTGILTLTMYNTAFALPEGFSSEYVETAKVETVENGVVLTLQTKGIWGYSLEYTDSGTRLFLKRTPTLSADSAKPLTGVRVMLDPGHGGTDIGAPGLMNELGPNEKDINLTLANAIAYRLRQLGAEVLMTRTDDTFVSLDDRLLAQTEFKPDFFLSVHHDSVELTRDLNDVVGMKAFYYHPYNPPPSIAFAQNLIDAVAPATGRAVADAGWGYYYVTRTTVCPSVLFEYGFVVIPSEFELVTSTEGIYAAAVATADGIMATLPQSTAETPAAGGDATGDASSSATAPVAVALPAGTVFEVRKRIR
ncbi:MAG: N-acetylmuramoyl-L-alanine amidase [Oscillospiraceae bacterium]